MDWIDFRVYKAHTPRYFWFTAAPTQLGLKRVPFRSLSSSSHCRQSLGVFRIYKRSKREQDKVEPIEKRVQQKKNKTRTKTHTHIAIKDRYRFPFIYLEHTNKTEHS